MIHYWLTAHVGFQGVISQIIEKERSRFVDLGMPETNGFKRVIYQRCLKHTN